MSFEELKLERMLDPYYYLATALYYRAAQQLADVPRQHIQFTGSDVVVSYSVRYVEPAYITLKALISILRIDPDEKMKLLEKLEQANNVYTIQLNEEVYAICAAVDPKKCEEEVHLKLCDENKESGCLKIVHLEEETLKKHIIVSSLRLKRLAALLPEVGKYLLKTLRKEELPIYHE